MAVRSGGGYQLPVDESGDELGQSLQLPDWLEPHRTEIEPGLQPLPLA
ncbi:MAG: hypothetical protein ACE5FI_16895 [Anaerolineales bacterium]